MPNGNSAVIKQIKEVIERGGNLDPNTRDVLFLSAIVDIYDQIELLVKENKILREETRPAVQFSKTSLYFLTVVGVAILGFIGALLTHRVELVFK